MDLHDQCGMVYLDQIKMGIMGPYFFGKVHERPCLFFRELPVNRKKLGTFLQVNLNFIYFARKNEEVERFFQGSTILYFKYIRSSLKVSLLAFVQNKTRKYKYWSAIRELSLAWREVVSDKGLSSSV